MRLSLRSKHWDDRIASLDADRDAQEIVVLLSNHVFPLEILLALEIAQLRTFTIPTISRILHATRQYEDEGQKRLDDTRAILIEIHESPRDSNAQHEMVAHLNRIHGHYAISNDDYLYTLSTFVFDPWLFVERHGHRRFTEKEKRAFYVFYRRLGEAMGIREIPNGFDAFFAWRNAYEARARRYTSDNEHVALGMLRAIAALLPEPVRPHLAPVVSALIDDAGFAAAIGLAPAGPVVRAGVRAFLDAKRVVGRFVNPFESDRLWDHPFFAIYQSYPNGYQRLRLGPEKVIAMLDRRDRAAREAAN